MEYYAYISYKREDELWAKWLQHKLERYRFPSNLNGISNLPKNIRPTFRDTTDLTPGFLAEEIYKALRSSEWLIIICSPRSAKSSWVCKEAQAFIDSGRADHIIPFVIEGNPFSKDPDNECYPEALLKLTGIHELLAANINEMGREAAFIKVVARMFNLRFDTLWQRHKKAETKKKYGIITILSIFLILATLISGKMIQKDWETMKIQDRAVIERINVLTEQGNSYLAKLLLLEILPKESFWRFWPNRPYIPEINDAIRVCTKNNSAIFKGKYATISPNTELIAAVTEDDEVVIYKTYNAQEIYRTQTLVENSYSNINSLIFSPDNNLIAYSVDKKCVVREINTGDILYQKESSNITDIYFSLSFSPDSRYLAIGMENGEIEIIDIHTEELYAYLSIPHADDFSVVNYVRSVQFSPDGERLACGTVDGRVRIFNLINNTKEAEYHAHSDQVISISFSPDGCHLVSNSYDNHICIYNINDARIENISKANDIYGDCGTDIAYHPSGEYFATSSNDNNVIIWDKYGYKIKTLSGHSKGINTVEYSSDGKFLITASDDNTIKLWDIANPLSWDKNFVRHSHHISEVSFSPDNEMIISSSHDNTSKIWNASTGELMQIFMGHDSWIRAACMSPDEKCVATASDDGTIRLWDITNGDCIKILEGHDYWVLDIAFSSDSKYLVSASGDCTLKLWDLSTGKEVMNYIGHENMVSSVAFNTDDTLIYSSSRDATVRVWDVKTGECKKVLTGHTDRIPDLAVNYPYSLFASSDGEKIRIWDSNTYECVKVFYGGWSIAFSDNKFAYTMLDGSICIVDCSTWSCIRVINDTPWITSMSFSNDGHYLVTSTDEGTIQIWDTHSEEELISKIRERFKMRTLTSDERKENYLE